MYSEAPIAVAVTPDGRETAIGFVWGSFAELLPSWPSVSLPQAYMVPFEPRAYPLNSPAAIAVMVTPVGIWTMAGVESELVVLFPSSPLSPRPQA